MATCRARGAQVGVGGLPQGSRAGTAHCPGNTQVSLRNLQPGPSLVPRGVGGPPDTVPGGDAAPGPAHFLHHPRESTSTLLSLTQASPWSPPLPLRGHPRGHHSRHLQHQCPVTFQGLNHLLPPPPDPARRTKPAPHLVSRVTACTPGPPHRKASPVGPSPPVLRAVREKRPAASWAPSPERVRGSPSGSLSYPIPSPCPPLSYSLPPRPPPSSPASSPHPSPVLPPSCSLSPLPPPTAPLPAE